MEKNEGKVDRIIRIILGVILIGAGFFVKLNIAEMQWVSMLSWIVGGISLITGVIGFCGLYKLFGINTCKIDTSK